MAAAVPDGRPGPLPHLVREPGRHLTGLLHDIPHVVTAHSLEPHRPWKAEQLGGGYRLSSWAERTAFEAADAVIAVSAGMRTDTLESYPDLDPDKVHVVKNGIDTDEFAPDTGTDIVTGLGIDLDQPSVVFVGRITRQKGLIHLVRAAEQLDPDTQLVLLAGAPDTPEIAQQFGDAFAHLQSSRGNVIWVEEMLPRAQVRQVLSHATVFACPSVYEPLGIVNLEAMACETAVVASAVGGIPEVVVDGETGYLVPYDPAQADDPAAIAEFEQDLADQDQRADPRIRTGRGSSAGPAGSAASTSSAGPRSPRRPSTSTGRRSRSTAAEDWFRCRARWSIDRYADRAAAGRRARRMIWPGTGPFARPVVLALPRGGVPVAADRGAVAAPRCG